MFDQLCKHEWTIYAEKYNFDLIVLKQSLDDSDRARLRSPAWQKLLILSQSWSNQYDQIVWLDSDIIINNKNAPDISENLPIELISAVDAYQIPNKEYHDIGLERIYKN